MTRLPTFRKGPAHQSRYNDRLGPNKGGSQTSWEPSRLRRDEDALAWSGRSLGAQQKSRAPNQNQRPWHALGDGLAAAAERAPQVEDDNSYETRRGEAKDQIRQYNAQDIGSTPPTHKCEKDRGFLGPVLL